MNEQEHRSQEKYRGGVFGNACIDAWLKSTRPTIIFGDGNQGGIIYEFCRRYHKDVVAVMTSDASHTNRKKFLPDIERAPLVFPDSYPGDRGAVDVIIATERDVDSVRERLRDEGYRNVYYAYNWTEGNLQIAQGRTNTNYKFCDELSDFQMIVNGRIDRENSLTLCCAGGGRTPCTSFGDTPQETFSRVFGMRALAVAESVLRSDGTSPCRSKETYGCSACYRFREQDRPWYYSPFVSYVNLTVAPSPCQCHCIYCANLKDWYRWSPTEEVIKAYDKLFETFEYGKQTGLIRPDATWQISPGEITIHPYKDRFLDLVEDSNAIFYTNGFLFNERIAENLHRNPASKINISIDSGTPQTWKAIKGSDNYEQVKANLVEYHKRSCIGGKFQFDIKYILLPGINDSDSDYNGLFEFVGQFGTRHIQLSRDNRLYSQFDAETDEHDLLMRAAARFVAMGKSNDIDVIPHNYTVKELKIINELAEVI